MTHQETKQLATNGNGSRVLARGSEGGSWTWKGTQSFIAIEPSQDVAPPKPAAINVNAILDVYVAAVHTTRTLNLSHSGKARRRGHADE